MSKEVRYSMAAAFLVIAAAASLLVLEFIPGLAAWTVIIVAVLGSLVLGGYLERRRRKSANAR